LSAIEVNNSLSNKASVDCGIKYYAELSSVIPLIWNGYRYGPCHNKPLSTQIYV